MVKKSITPLFLGSIVGKRKHSVASKFYFWHHDLYTLVEIVFWILVIIVNGDFDMILAVSYIQCVTITAHLWIWWALLFLSSLGLGKLNWTSSVGPNCNTILIWFGWLQKARGWHQNGPSLIKFELDLCGPLLFLPFNWALPMGWGHRPHSQFVC